MASIDTLSLDRRETMAEAIAEKLIQYIGVNRLRGGDKLPSEREMVEMTGASRLPLREALCILKGLGIVETKHGKGVFVKKLDIGAVFGMLSPLLRTQADIDVKHVFDVRFFLDAGVAEAAAANRSEENLQAMREALDGMRANVDQQEAYVRYDMDFHLELGRSTGNPVFQIMMTSISDLLNELQFFYDDSIEYRGGALIEHEEIFDAVNKQDGPRAQKAAKEHLRNAVERIVPGKKSDHL